MHNHDIVVASVFGAVMFGFWQGNAFAAAFMFIFLLFMAPKE